MFAMLSTITVKLINNDRVVGSHKLDLLKEDIPCITRTSLRKHGDYLGRKKENMEIYISHFKSFLSFISRLFTAIPAMS